MRTCPVCGSKGKVFSSKTEPEKIYGICSNDDCHVCSEVAKSKWGAIMHWNAMPRPKW